MKQISKQELIDMLRNQKGATFATIAAITEPKMKKIGNPYFGRKVEKFQVSNVTINFIYANSVNRELVKEGKEADFVPHQRQWGQRIQGTPLVEHKGKYYLECRFTKASTPVYLLDGSEIEKEKLADYLPTANSNAAHQGVDPEKEIIIRDFSIDTIREIKMNSEHYQITA